MVPNYGSSIEDSSRTDPELSTNKMIVSNSPRSTTQQAYGFTVLCLVLVSTLATFIAVKSGHLNLLEQLSQIDFDESTPSRPPNFIFILADDMAFNSIGYEPYDMAFVTPALTKLSARGIRNLNSYSQEMCTPARAALMTGLTQYNLPFHSHPPALQVFSLRNIVL